ncbi:MAG: hypothetical protein HKN48_02795 [Flavobacteriaceae bacterium]|nr:hypothetical protein [Flavobacteriaceae bacterium]
MKYTLYIVLSFLLLTTFVSAQVGLSNSNPEGLLDVTSTTTGVVYPQIALSSTTTETVLNPNGGSIVAGTVIYNTATAGSGTTAVRPGIYIWNGSEWISQFHRREYKMCSQNGDLRPGSDDLLNPVLGDQVIPFDSNSFTPDITGNYLVTVTVHYGGGRLDPPNYANDQHVNFNSSEGEYDFTFNGTTHNFTLKSFSGSNDDRLFDGGSFNEHINSTNQTIYTVSEALTRSTLYPFTLTFNQVNADGFEANGDNILLEDGRGYITQDGAIKCTVEFKFIGK